MPAVRDYVTRRLARRCRAAGPAYNTRGVFGRRVIRPEDLDYFIDPENAPAPEFAQPKPDMYRSGQSPNCMQRRLCLPLYSEPIRDVVAEQLARIRGAEGPEKEQYIAALFLFLTLNVDRISANPTQLNAYRALARHYGRVGMVAQAITNEFLAAT